MNRRTVAQGVAPPAAPKLTMVTAIPGGTRIEGSLQSTANSLFRIELFANAERDEEPGANDGGEGEFGEGQTFLGSVNGMTNASGVVPMWRKPDRFDIGRIAVDRELSDEMFLGQLAIPQLAYRHRG